MTEGSAFLRANPGFALDFQFVDVPDYQGAGESAPVPYFYQVWLLPGPGALCSDSRHMPRPGLLWPKCQVLPRPLIGAPASQHRHDVLPGSFVFGSCKG